MANNVTFTENEVSTELTSGEQLFQAKINPAGVLATAALASEVGNNLKEPSTFVEGIIKEIANVAKSHLGKGERVLLDGLCHIELYPEGSFTTEDADWDPDVHRIVARTIPYDAIKKAAEGVVPTNTLSKVTIQLLGEQDATTKEQNSLKIGNVALFQGKNIQITQANEDEGFYLVKDAKCYKGTISDNTAGTADVTFPGLVAGDVGDGWTFEVRGRAGLGTNRSLVTARISDVTIVA